MKTEKDIDKLFKHALKEPVDEIAYRESDWDAFEQLLDAGKKRPGIIYWLPVLCSAAAVLLFLGWWMFRAEVGTNQVKPRQQVAVNRTKAAQQQVVIEGQHTKNIESGAPVKIQEKNSPPPYLAGNNLSEGRRQVKNAIQLPRLAKYQGSNNTKNQKAEMGYNEVNTTGYTTLAAGAGSSTVNKMPLNAFSPAIRITPDRNNMPLIAAVNILLKKSADNSGGSMPGKLAVKKTSPSSFYPVFGLSVLASSEMNGVGSLRETSSGINFGVLFSAGYKKFKLSTGASYSLKPYSLPFDEYHTNYRFKNSPETVTADCRVLDIPLNLDYMVYNKHRNRVSLGTGLSSYIMMHESYSYDYGNDNALYGPSYYAVKNRASYLFSIMNIQATYQRQVNSNAWLTFQPYLKVPLSNIGYSQIKVETFGVAVGLNWNLNSLTKHK